ncbi:MAG: hypothetical protein ACT4QD_11035 [Acidobacteriota bacterium]
MTERNLLIAGGIAGALAGVAVTYLLFTERGQRRRLDVERGLTTFLEEAERLLAAADEVRRSVAEYRGGTDSGWPRSA